MKLLGVLAAGPSIFLSLVTSFSIGVHGLLVLQSNSHVGPGLYRVTGLFKSNHVRTPPFTQYPALIAPQILRK